MLKLKDPKTLAEYLIEPRGMIVGREGGDADIRLRDSGVSKRHARIFSENGAWFIEDLNSSNGTFLNDEAISGRAFELPTGARLRLASHPLEVTFDAGARRATERKSGSPTRAAPRVADEPSEPGYKPTMEHDFREDSPAGEAARRDSPDRETPARDATRNASSGREAPRGASARASKQETRDAPKPAGKAEKANPAGKVESPAAQVMASIPKAIAYFTKAVPAMAVNPVGYVRKGIAEQEHEEKGAIELIAYAVPAQLVGAALGFLTGVIAQVVGKIRYDAPISVGALIPVVPLAIAVVAGIVAGLIWHPVVGWVIRFLKGDSDARSRTNYFMAMMTATVLLTVPTAVASLLAIVNLPLINLVGPILGLGASLLMVFLAYSWFVYFKVHPIVPKVILVLGALAVLGTAVGTIRTMVSDVQTVVARLRSSSSSSSSASASTAPTPATDTEASAIATATLNALEKHGAEKRTADGAEAATGPGTAGSSGSAAGTGSAPSGKPTPRVVAATSGKEPLPDPEVLLASPARADRGSEAAEPSSTAPGGYGDWVQHREAIEKIIERDPTLLRKPRVLTLYRQLHKALYEANGKYTSRNPAEAKVNERLRQAEAFEQSHETVAELHRRLLELR